MFTILSTLTSIKRSNALRFTNTVTTALVAAAAATMCTTASASPMLTFENTSATSNVFEAGGTFTLDLTLDFDADDTGGINVVGTSFDLIVRSRDGVSSFPDFKLIEIARPATGPFDFSVVSGSGLDISMNSTGTTAGDLGALTLFGNGASAGPVRLGSYTFALGLDALAGEYDITLGGIIDPIVTLIDETEMDLVATSAFQFRAVVPEPTTASLFVALLTCVWLRRRR